MNSKTFKTLLSALFIAFVHFNISAQISEKIKLSKDNQLLGLGTQYLLKSEILVEEFHYLLVMKTMMLTILYFIF